MDRQQWQAVYEKAREALSKLDDMASTFPADDTIALPFLRKYNQAVAAVMTVRAWSLDRMDVAAQK